MIYFYSFVFAGMVCFIAQLIYDNTKLTAGHITSAFVVLGAVLGIFNLYDPLVKIFGGGATTLIINFGNLLVKGGVKGMETHGALGIFTNLFELCSGTLTFTVFIAALFALIFKPKQ